MQQKDSIQQDFQGFQKATVLLESSRKHFFSCSYEINVHMNAQLHTVGVQKYKSVPIWLPCALLLMAKTAKVTLASTPVPLVLLNLARRQQLCN